uniref:Putative DNA binding, helix-turn-helix domain containing protein n=1 Tax=viral metagenome TaxID=1070528 RepID=A0A6H1ZES0_9ZZZZ
METHWTERSIKDYRFRIIADFISQLEEKMDREKINRDDLAKLLDKTKGRISQLLNNPGNITFDNIVKLARALKFKVSLVAYEDNDPENKKGPINSEIFKICWEKAGKPQDFWEVHQTQ